MKKQRHTHTLWKKYNRDNKWWKDWILVGNYRNERAADLALRDMRKKFKDPSFSSMINLNDPIYDWSFKITEIGKNPEDNLP